MVEKTKFTPVTPTGPIDCACVIHGDAYSWTYVDRLYNMLNRHITPGIKLHVYTEATRPVPEPMIKHSLIDWGIAGPKRGWWYKMQLFNTENFAGPLLYFDLDTVVVGNLDWIWNLNLRWFWAVQDFKYLWRPTHQGLNSSVMWWDTRSTAYLWKRFRQQNLQEVIKAYPGDQDYLSRNLDTVSLRFFPQNRMLSWRWQCINGGYNFKQRIYNNPGAPSMIVDPASVLIFHGKPKPDAVADSIVVDHWR